MKSIQDMNVSLVQINLLISTKISSLFLLLWYQLFQTISQNTAIVSDENANEVANNSQRDDYSTDITTGRSAVGEKNSPENMKTPSKKRMRHQ